MDRLYGENKEEGKMGVQLDETEKRIVDLIEANRDEIIALQEICIHMRSLDTRNLRLRKNLPG